MLAGRVVVTFRAPRAEVFSATAGSALDLDAHLDSPLNLGIIL
jgi:hypothetical protein